MDIINLDQLRDLPTLSRAIFQANISEETIRSLPSQTLYQVLRYNGLESSLEIIEAASLEQTRSLLDFDLWSANAFNEDQIWNWLELSSEDDELSILQKVVSSLDLKLVALLIARYLEVQQNEEPTDRAPGPLFYTPDRGLTWIRVLCEDQRKHFLMSKLLAFLFESNADVFYQLLATKAVATPAMLEEEATLDRRKRLAAEGLPDEDLTAQATGFLSVQDALQQITVNDYVETKRDTIVIESLVRISDTLEPLTSALKATKRVEENLSELTLLVNACLLRFSANFSDTDQTTFLAVQTQGALNLGLDLLVRRSGISSEQIIDKVGLQVPFRVGLTQILDVAKKAKQYEKDLTAQGIEIDQPTRLLLDHLYKPFPSIPSALSQHRSDYQIEGDLLATRPEPFRYFGEIEQLNANLKGSE